MGGKAFRQRVCSDVAKTLPLGPSGLEVNAVKSRISALRAVLSTKEHRASMIRDEIKAALVTAMKGGDKAATGTIRLIQSAIKNRDIELRTSSGTTDDDLVVTEVLQKMIKQRRESAELYRKGNREELAATEEAEIAVIERFLPKQMSDEEANAAIQAIIADTGASGMKDMGKVMGEVKSRLAGQIDPARASAMVRTALV